jgi:hypothetical protein
VALSFEQAAALAVAINARLYDLSKVDRSTKTGAREGMPVSVYRDARRIGVNKGRTRARPDRPPPRKRRPAPPVRI